MYPDWLKGQKAKGGIVGNVPTLVFDNGTVIIGEHVFTSMEMQQLHKLVWPDDPVPCPPPEKPSSE